jgi:hypothetical protein
MSCKATLEQDSDHFAWFEENLSCPTLETRLQGDLESAGLLEVSVSTINGKITRVSKHPELKAETRMQKYSKFFEIRTLITSFDLEET